MINSFRLAVFLFACISTFSASAAVARLDVIGNVTGVDGDQLMTATFFLDTSTANDLDSTSFAQYLAPTIEGTIVIGDSVYTARTAFGSNSVSIRNESSSGFDVFGFQAEIENESGDSGLFVVELFDDSRQAFDSIDFPASDFDLSLFNVSDVSTFRPSVFSLFGIDGIDAPLLGYEISSVTYTVVPLPAAGWLFLSTLAGLGVLRRR